jgi:hypothetical protein
MLTNRRHVTAQCREEKDTRMPSFAFRPPSVRRWILLPAAGGLIVAAAFLAGADPARADILPTLTSFAVSATSVDVTYGDAHITVTMSVSDPDATGVGSGDIIAHGPTRGYNPSGHLVQVGGTATNTQYRTDITLPAGKAVDYRMDITFMEADQFYLVDLQSQLVSSGWPYHVQASVTAAPAAPAKLTFHRELQGGTSTIVVSWAPPTSGQPVPTGSTVTGNGCGTLQSSNAADARFTGVPKSTTTCTATVNLLNSAGSSPPTTASARV